MKKFVTLFIVLALAGAITTTAMAAPDSPTDSGGTSQTEERVLIIATATFGGQVKSTDDGTEPEFDPEYPAIPPQMLLQEMHLPQQHLRQQFQEASVQQ